MPEQLQTDRFKAEMPQIPGVASQSSRRQFAINPAVPLVGGLLAVLLVCFLAARWMSHPKPAEAPVAAAPAQIVVPAPPVDPTAAFPHATEKDPNVATLSEMAKPWTSKDFFYVNPTTGENVRALLIHLPSASANRPQDYWALNMTAPYGNCPLEYITDTSKLQQDYDFHGAKHPMVGNPCSRTVFDPLKMMIVPGNVWVRGGMVQGSDLRPPLGIEVKIQGKDILAVRME
jgi:hypothetical protein